MLHRAPVQGLAEEARISLWVTISKVEHKSCDYASELMQGISVADAARGIQASKGSVKRLHIILSGSLADAELLRST